MLLDWVHVMLLIMMLQGCGGGVGSITYTAQSVVGGGVLGRHFNSFADGDAERARVLRNVG